MVILKEQLLYETDFLVVSRVVKLARFKDKQITKENMQENSQNYTAIVRFLKKGENCSGIQKIFSN